MVKLKFVRKQSDHIETNQLIYNTNQWTGFYVILVFIERYYQTDFSDLFEKSIDLFQNFIITLVAEIDKMVPIFISKQMT